MDLFGSRFIHHVEEEKVNENEEDHSKPAAKKKKY